MKPFSWLNNHLNPDKIGRDKINQARTDAIYALAAQINAEKSRIRAIIEEQQAEIEACRQRLETDRVTQIEAYLTKLSAELINIDLLPAAIEACMTNTNLNAIQKVIDLLEHDPSSFTTQKFLELNPVGVAMIFDSHAACDLLLTKLEHLIIPDAPTVIGETLLMSLQYTYDTSYIRRIRAIHATQSSKEWRDGAMQALTGAELYQAETAKHGARATLEHFISLLECEYAHNNFTTERALQLLNIVKTFIQTREMHAHDPNAWLTYLAERSMTAPIHMAVSCGYYSEAAFIAAYEVLLHVQFSSNVSDYLKKDAEDVYKILSYAKFMHSSTQIFATKEVHLAISEYGHTPLTYAIEQHRLDMVAYILELGASPNVKTSRGYTPMHMAIMQHSLAAIKLLVLNGANITIPFIDPRDPAAVEISPIEFAYNYNAPEIAEYLRLTQIVREFIDNFSDKDLHDPATIFWAVENNYTDTVCWLYQTGLITTENLNKALSIAIEHENPHMVHLLLRHGAILDPFKLIQATHNLTAKASATVVTGSFSISISGRPYTRARQVLDVLQAWQAAYKFSIQAIARHRFENGQTMLTNAVIANDITKVRHLLACGAPIDEKNTEFKTPLHLAAELGYIDIAKLLVACGARTNFNSGEYASGITAHDFATARGTDMHAWNVVQYLASVKLNPLLLRTNIATGQSVYYTLSGNAAPDIALEESIQARRHSWLGAVTDMKYVDLPLLSRRLPSTELTAALSVYAADFFTTTPPHIEIVVDEIDEMQVRAYLGATGQDYFWVYHNQINKVLQKDADGKFILRDYHFGVNYSEAMLQLNLAHNPAAHLPLKALLVLELLHCMQLLIADGYSITNASLKDFVWDVEYGICRLVGFAKVRLEHNPSLANIASISRELLRACGEELPFKVQRQLKLLSHEPTRLVAMCSDMQRDLHIYHDMQYPAVWDKEPTTILHVSRTAETMPNSATLVLHGAATVTNLSAKYTVWHHVAGQLHCTTVQVGILNGCTAFLVTPNTPVVSEQFLASIGLALAYIHGFANVNFVSPDLKFITACGEEFANSTIDRDAIMINGEHLLVQAVASGDTTALLTCETLGLKADIPYSSGKTAPFIAADNRNWEFLKRLVKLDPGIIFAKDAKTGKMMSYYIGLIADSAAVTDALAKLQAIAYMDGFYNPTLTFATACTLAEDNWLSQDKVDEYQLRSQIFELKQRNKTDGGLPFDEYDFFALTELLQIKVSIKGKCIGPDKATNKPLVLDSLFSMDKKTLLGLCTFASSLKDKPTVTKLLEELAKLAAIRIATNTKQQNKELRARIKPNLRFCVLQNRRAELTAGLPDLTREHVARSKAHLESEKTAGPVRIAQQFKLRDEQLIAEIARLNQQLSEQFSILDKQYAKGCDRITNNYAQIREEQKFQLCQTILVTAITGVIGSFAAPVLSGALVKAWGLSGLTAGFTNAAVQGVVASTGSSIATQSFSLEGYVKSILASTIGYGIGKIATNSFSQLQEYDKIVGAVSYSFVDSLVHEDFKHMLGNMVLAGGIQYASSGIGEMAVSSMPDVASSATITNTYTLTMKDALQSFVVGASSAAMYMYGEQVLFNRDADPSMLVIQAMNMIFRDMAGRQAQRAIAEQRFEDAARIERTEAARQEQFRAEEERLAQAQAQRGGAEQEGSRGGVDQNTATPGDRTTPHVTYTTSKPKVPVVDASKAATVTDTSSGVGKPKAPQPKAVAVQYVNVEEHDIHGHKNVIPKPDSKSKQLHKTLQSTGQRVQAVIAAGADLISNTAGTLIEQVHETDELYNGDRYVEDLDKRRSVYHQRNEEIRTGISSMTKTAQPVIDTLTPLQSMSRAIMRGEHPVAHQVLQTKKSGATLVYAAQYMGETYAAGLRESELQPFDGTKKAADVALPFTLGGYGVVRAGGRAVLATGRAAQVFAAKHGIRSPLLFKFGSGKFYTGFPIDVVELRSPFGRAVVYGRGNLGKTGAVAEYGGGNASLSSFSQHKSAYASLGEQIACGSSKIPQHKYDLWYNYLTKRGVKFEIGTPKAHRTLLEHDAKGLFVRKCVDIETNIWERTIYLKENFEAHTFYEEALHALDSIKSRPGTMLHNDEFINAYEFRAKSILMNSSESRGFTYEQFVELEHHLELVMQNRY